MHPLLLLSFLSAVLSVPLGQELTPSWVQVCGGTYLFSEDKKSWDDAYGECELYGSHLAQIDGIEENFCLLEYAHTEGLPADWYLHSANDISSEGVCDSMMDRWSSGLPGGRMEKVEAEG